MLWKTCLPLHGLPKALASGGNSAHLKTRPQCHIWAQKCKIRSVYILGCRRAMLLPLVPLHIQGWLLPCGSMILLVAILLLGSFINESGFSWSFSHPDLDSRYLVLLAWILYFTSPLNRVGEMWFCHRRCQFYSLVLIAFLISLCPIIVLPMQSWVVGAHNNKTLGVQFVMSNSVLSIDSRMCLSRYLVPHCRLSFCLWC